MFYHLPECGLASEVERDRKNVFFVEYFFREKIELKAGVIGEHDGQ